MILKGAVRIALVDSGLAAMSRARNSDFLPVKTDGGAESGVAEGLGTTEAEGDNRAKADADETGVALAECLGEDTM